MEKLALADATIEPYRLYTETEFAVITNGIAEKIINEMVVRKDKGLKDLNKEYLELTARTTSSKKRKQPPRSRSTHSTPRKKSGTSSKHDVMIADEDEALLFEVFKHTQDESEHEKFVRNLAPQFCDGLASWDQYSNDDVLGVKSSLKIGKYLLDYLNQQNGTVITIMWLGVGNGQELVYIVLYLYLADRSALGRLRIIAFEQYESRATFLAGVIAELRHNLGADEWYFGDSKIFILTGDYAACLHLLFMVDNNVSIIYCLDSGLPGNSKQFSMSVKLHTALLHTTLYRSGKMFDEDCKNLTGVEVLGGRPAWATEADAAAVAGSELSLKSQAEAQAAKSDGDTDKRGAGPPKAAAAPGMTICRYRYIHTYI
jgi:hypothetical protein